MLTSKLKTLQSRKKSSLLFFNENKNTITMYINSETEDAPESLTNKQQMEMYK